MRKIRNTALGLLLGLFVSAPSSLAWDGDKFDFDAELKGGRIVGAVQRVVDSTYEVSKPLITYFPFVVPYSLKLRAGAASGPVVWTGETDADGLFATPSLERGVYFLEMNPAPVHWDKGRLTGRIVVGSQSCTDCEVLSIEPFCPVFGEAYRRPCSVESRILTGHDLPAHVSSSGICSSTGPQPIAQGDVLKTGRKPDFEYDLRGASLKGAVQSRHTTYTGNLEDLKFWYEPYPRRFVLFLHRDSAIREVVWSAESDDSGLFQTPSLEPGHYLLEVIPVEGAKELNGFVGRIHITGDTNAQCELISLEPQCLMAGDTKYPCHLNSRILPIADAPEHT